jgi:hypothetical protein
VVPTEPEMIEYLEDEGEHKIRLYLASNRFTGQWLPIVTKWLAAKDQEAARLSAAFKSEEIEVARAASAAAQRAADAAERASAAAERQATAAERANRTAVIALAIAIISIIATAIGIWVSHRDTTR